MTSAFEQLQEMMGRGEVQQPVTYPMPDAQLAALREIEAAYKLPPFPVGALVTPRKNCSLRGHGQPFIVVESLENPECRHDADSGDADYDARFDIRVIHCTPDGTVLTHWAESWQMEPYMENLSATRA